MNPRTQDAQVLTRTEQAAAVLHPLRGQILTALREPQSATVLAGRLGLPRQRVNYHLRELERRGLVALVEERRKGNCVERILCASAHSFVIGPQSMGALAADPAEVQDRFSAAYLTALVSRALSDLGQLRDRADRAGKRLPTFSLQADVRFASAGDRAAFTEELSRDVARLAAKYHDEAAPGGRRFRFLLGAYPRAGDPPPAEPGGRRH